jgi:hypothetical protein
VSKLRAIGGSQCRCGDGAEGHGKAKKATAVVVGRFVVAMGFGVNGFDEGNKGGDLLGGAAFRLGDREVGKLRRGGGFLWDEF